MKGKYVFYCGRCKDFFTCDFKCNIIVSGDENRLPFCLCMDCRVITNDPAVCHMRKVSLEEAIAHFL